MIHAQPIVDPGYIFARVLTHGLRAFLAAQVDGATFLCNLSQATSVHRYRTIHTNVKHLLLLCLDLLMCAHVLTCIHTFRQRAVYTHATHLCAHVGHLKLRMYAHVFKIRPHTRTNARTHAHTHTLRLNGALVLHNCLHAYRTTLGTAHVCTYSHISDTHTFTRTTVL